MRDDLHKKAPIPRKAQNVFKLAGRPADRQCPERLHDAAVHALEQAIQLGVSPATIQALSGKADQGELFGLAGARRQACSPMEGDVFSKMALGPDKTDACTALTQALRGVGDSYTREVRATLIAEGNVRDVGEIVRSFSEAFASAAETVAKGVCTGERKQLASERASLDENLLPRPTKRAAK